MNSVSDVIIMNGCDQIDGFRVVLRTKTCVRMLTIITLAAAAALVVGAGVGAAATTWYVDDGGGADFTRIQDAVSNASMGDTIYVAAGEYTENVVVNKQLTLIGDGVDVVTVQAASLRDPMFEVTVDWVNISGFTATGATYYGGCGIYLDDVDHCNISNNNASNNEYGIHLYFSNDNKITGNTANNNGDSAIMNDRGIFLYSSNNNTITGNTANYNYGRGIELMCSSNNTVIGNIANYNEGNNNNDGYGIYLWDSSSNNTITGNTVNNNDNGIFLRWSCHNTTIAGNIANNNSYGISLYASSNNNLTENVMSDNSCNFGLDGDEDSHFDNNIDATNLVDGKLIYCVRDASDVIIDSNTINIGTIYCIGCNAITIKDLTLKNNSAGVFFWNTSNSRVENVNVSNNGYGILLSSSINNTITSNTANDNEGGMGLSNSNDNMLSGNTIDGNEVGILLVRSSNNTLQNNNVSNNEGVTFQGGIIIAGSSNNLLVNNNVSNSACGIVLNRARNNNVLMNNTVSNNEYGIALSEDANNNILKGNTVDSNSQYGVYVSESHSNTITCNLVQNNTRGFYLDDGSAANNISYNNIIENGNYSIATGGYEWQFENDQSDDVDATNNWWGTNDEANITASICDWNDDPSKGNVTYLPRLEQPASCAPISDEPLTFTTADAAIALQIAVGSRGYDSRWDVNYDGVVTSLDALTILQAAAGGIAI